MYCNCKKQRFIPAEFGNDPARESTLAPFEAIHEDRRKIRRATEAAEIPHTYVCGNTFGSYFVSHLLNPHEERDEVVVYGTGEAKGISLTVILYILFNLFFFSDAQ